MCVSQVIPGLGKQTYLPRHRFSHALFDSPEFGLILGLFSSRSWDGYLSSGNHMQRTTSRKRKGNIPLICFFNKFGKSFQNYPNISLARIMSHDHTLINQLSWEMRPLIGLDKSRFSPSHPKLFFQRYTDTHKMVNKV